MSDLEVTILLPEELVERARAVGIHIEDQTEELTAALEARIRRREAGQKLLDIIAENNKLPDDVKPTSEEIDAEIRAYRAEKKLRDSHGK